MTDKTTEPEVDELDEIRTLAARVEEVMPTIARRLFTIDPAHPLAEIPIAQLRLCALLVSQGSPTMSQLAEELRISVSAVTQLADRLERAGLVERVSAAEVTNGPGERDRRSRHLRLTEQGRELMLSRRELRQSGAREALAHLTSKERHKVIAGLELLLNASRLVPEPGSAESLPDVHTPENIAHLEWKAGQKEPGSETAGATSPARNGA